MSYMMILAGNCMDEKSGTSTHFKDHYGDPFCWADSPKNAGGPQWEIFCIMVSMDIYWNIPLGTWTICYVPNYWVRWFIYHNEHFSWQIIPAWHGRCRCFKNTLLLDICWTLEVMPKQLPPHLSTGFEDKTDRWWDGGGMTIQGTTYSNIDVT